MNVLLNACKRLSSPKKEEGVTLTLPNYTADQEGSCDCVLCPAKCFPELFHPSQKEVRLNRYELESRYDQLVRDSAARFPPPLERDRKKVFRICTYNVHMHRGYSGVGGPHGMLQAIRDIDADVLCLQESDSSEIRDGLGKMYPFVHHVQEGWGYGNAICSKLPLLDLKDERFHDKKGGRGMVVATVQMGENGAPLTIVCTHLDVFDETGKKRVKQVDELVAMTKNMPNHSVIVGDFNGKRADDYQAAHFEWLNNQENMRMHRPLMCHEMDKLYEKGYRDAFRDVGSTPCVSCWSLRRIDYQLLPVDFPYKVNKAFVMPNAASDHLPIVVDYEKP